MLKLQNPHIPTQVEFIKPLQLRYPLSYQLILYYLDLNDIKYMHENNHRHNLGKYYCKIPLDSNSIIMKIRMRSIYRAKLYKKLNHRTSNYNKNHSLKIIQSNKVSLHFLLNWLQPKLQLNFLLTFPYVQLFSNFSYFLIFSIYHSH